MKNFETQYTEIRNNSDENNYQHVIINMYLNSVEAEFNLETLIKTFLLNLNNLGYNKITTEEIITISYNENRLYNENLNNNIWDLGGINNILFDNILRDKKVVEILTNVIHNNQDFDFYVKEVEAGIKTILFSPQREIVGYLMFFINEIIIYKLKKLNGILGDDLLPYKNDEEILKDIQLLIIENDLMIYFD